MMGQKSPGRIPPGLAFGLCLILITGVFAATAAPSPFYELQQRQWGFPAALMTVAVAIYAVTFLAALLTIGSLADYVGHRFVIGVAMLAQATSMLLFISASSIEWVILGRAAQGLGMGAVVGALGACITLFAPGKSAVKLGPTVAAVSPQAGSALGSLTAGWAIQSLYQPGPLVFGCYAILFAIGGLAAFFLPGERPRRARIWSSLRPSLTVPLAARSAFWRAVPVIFAGWMLGALYLSLVPLLVREMLGGASPLTGGITIAAFSAFGAVAGLAAGRLSARNAATWGGSVMLVGALTAVLATLVGSFPLFAAATVLGALGYGGSNVGAIRTIIPLVDPAHRSEVFSAIYVVGYVAFGLPVILAGLAADSLGVVTVTFWYSVGTAALTLFGTVMVARTGAVVRNTASGALPNGGNPLATTDAHGLEQKLTSPPV